MKDTMHPAERKARAMLAAATLADLIDEWELTTDNNDPHIYTVRGWLMDEIQTRCPRAFDAWLDSPTSADDELKYYIMEMKG